MSNHSLQSANLTLNLSNTKFDLIIKPSPVRLRMKKKPCFLVSLCLFLSTFSLMAVESVNLKLETVVIDPGHGGKDAGAVSADKKTYEKTLVLNIAKALERKINQGCPEVKVVLTRRNDVFLPLLTRADIANRNNANLFISIHINASTKKQPSGFSAHILGESKNKKNDVFGLNMDVSKRENAVVMLEEDYSVKYQSFDPSDPASSIVFNLIQSAYYEQSLHFAECMDHSIAGTQLQRRGVSQDNFYVLWRTAMPAVLLECGFISNANDLAYLRSAAGIEAIAESIYKGFLRFKKDYESSAEAIASPVEKQASVTQTTPSQKSTPTPKESGRFGVQVLVSAKTDRGIDGFTPSIIKDGRYYKYIVVRSDSLEEVKKNLKNVKKKYPDSFIVEILENQVVPCKK